MLIVQVVDFGNDGDARYRLHDPSRQLGRMPGVTTVDCHFFSRFLPQLTELADILAVQFVNDWDLLDLCVRRQARGQVTVFEANDYFFDLQSWNPIAGHWQDRNVQQLYLKFLTLSDGVQTSTPELARRWKERGAREVAAFPNYMTSVPPLPAATERPLTIGWAGSPGHLADWYDLAPTIQSWLDAHPEVHLAVMTSEVGQPFFRLPKERYHFAPFGSLESYLQFLQRIDIGIAPLLPTGYNRCRSDVKFLEYASQGVAGIYADLEPYRDTVVVGETGFLYGSKADLIEKLDLLYQDESLRHRVRVRGHEYVSKQRILADHANERLHWYEGLLGNQSGNQALPTEIASQALREENYFQLPLQEPERALRESLQTANPNQALPLLAPVLAKYPEYVAAMQNQGKLLNDQRQHRQAIAVLEKIHELRPDSARAWAEIGRAWFRLDEDRKARDAMERAIRASSNYLPAWQYFLRMLAVTKSPEGPEWSRQATDLFSHSYPIALLGALTYPSDVRAKKLVEVLDRFEPSITLIDRSAALAAFRQSILDVIEAVPADAGLLEMLKRACQFFPESARLAAEYGSALHRAGEYEQAHEQHARALAIRRAATIEREEFPREPSPPLIWQLAEHIGMYSET